MGINGTNLEKINKTNLYDLLCRMNKSLEAAQDNKQFVCILDGFEVPEDYCETKDCEACIAKWLLQKVSYYKF